MFRPLILSTALALAVPIAAGSQNLPAPSPGDAAILAEARAADAAFMAAQSKGDLKAMADYIAEDYAYIDVSGGRVGKTKLLSRREGDHLSLEESEDSEEEAILLSPSSVLLRGKSDGTALYFGGLPRKNSTRWSAIWRKEADGRWRVIAEQTTPLGSQGYTVRARVPVEPAAVAPHTGTWRLATRTPLDLVLRAEGDTLKASIAGQFTDMPFLPEGPDSFFTTERPFELRFDKDGRTLTLVTWGLETAGERTSR